MGDGAGILRQVDALKTSHRRSGLALRAPRNDVVVHAFRFAASFCKSGALMVGMATRPGPVSGRAAAALSFSRILAITAWPARSNIARFSITNFCDSRSFAV